MAGVVPVTRNQSAGRLVNDAIASTTRVGEVDEFLFSRAMRELDALQKSDVVDAECKRALLLGVSGRFDEAEAAALNAERNGGWHSAQEARMKVRLNYMLFSEAAKFAKQLLANPGPLPLPMVMLPACGGGLFHSCAEAVEASAKANRVMQATEVVVLAQRASQALDEAGVSEDVVLRTLDELGVIAGRQSLLWLNEMPDISVLLGDEGGPLVRVAFRVDVTPDVAADMNWELVDRLVELDLAMSGFSAAFIGTAVVEELAAHVS